MRRGTVRYLGTLLVGLSLLGQLAAFAHFAAVRHATCADHGEVVHAGSPGRAEAQAPHDTTVAAAAGDSHGHDHCHLLSRLRERLAPAETPRLVEAAATRHEPGALPAPPATAVPRYRLAPKTSPPARA